MGSCWAGLPPRWTLGPGSLPGDSQELSSFWPQTIVPTFPGSGSRGSEAVGGVATGPCAALWLPTFLRLSPGTSRPRPLPVPLPSCPGCTPPTSSLSLILHPQERRLEQGVHLSRVHRSEVDVRKEKARWQSSCWGQSPAPVMGSKGLLTRGGAGCALHNPRKRKEAASPWASCSQVPGPATCWQEL